MKLLSPKKYRVSASRKHRRKRGSPSHPPTHIHTHGHLSDSPLPMEMGSWGCSICSTYF